MNNDSVTVLVFKYSVGAIFGLIIMSLFVILFFLFLLVSAPGYLWLFLPLAFIIIYIRYAKKAPFKTRVVDEKKLTLSADGIQYGDDFYSVNVIETVAVYLYAFENFEYRDGFVVGGGTKSVYVRAHGDQNKMSFRSEGKVQDFDFYLEDFASFCAVRKVLNDWSRSNINVVLKQPFDDEFIIREMEYYQTPSGL